MDAWMWVVIIVAAVVIIVLVIAAIAAQQRRRARTAHLRDTFGDEYDRVAGANGGRPSREGEAELRRREMRRSHLDIRPLSADQQQRYLAQWQEIQRTFVDVPDQSVANAETLVSQVMRDRGYPVADEFENQAELISVDHPDLVSNYREAHRVYERSLDNDADTEELRSSFVYYRSLFNELLAA
jgi:FtsZ-interacting cell division protein ZipA